LKHAPNHPNLRRYTWPVHWESLSALTRKWPWWGLKGLALGLGIGQLGQVLFNLFFTRRLFPAVRIRARYFTPGEARQLLSLSLQLFVISIGSIMVTQVPKIIIGVVLGPLQVALFHIAYAIITVIKQIASSLAVPLVPVVSYLQARGEDMRLQAIFLRSHKYIMGLSAPLFLFAGLLADDILYLYVQNTDPLAPLALRMMAGIYFLHAGAIAANYTMVGLGRPDCLMKANLISIPSNLVLTLLGIFFFGFIGAVLGTTLSLLIELIVFYRLSADTLGIRLSQIFGRISALPLISSVLAITPVFFLLRWPPCTCMPR